MGPVIVSIVTSMEPCRGACPEEGPDRQGVRRY
jgi:hypothetical protein